MIRVSAICLLAVFNGFAEEIIKVRDGVPNAVYFSRQNAVGNQHYFCIGDSRATPWEEFAATVARDMDVRTLPHIYLEPEGAGFARYSCVNGQAIYGERVFSGYIAVLDFSATGAKGDIKLEAMHLESLVRAIYEYRATHSVVIIHTTPSPYVAEAERVAAHYGIPSLDLTSARSAAERSERVKAFVAKLFVLAPVPVHAVSRTLPAPLHVGAELRPRIVSYEHTAVRFDDGWLGWQRPSVKELRHVIDSKRIGAKVSVSFVGSEIGLFDETSSQTSPFVATIDGGSSLLVEPPRSQDQKLRHTSLFRGLDPACEHVLTIEARSEKPLRLAGFSLCGSVKEYGDDRSPLERMRAVLKKMPPMTYVPPAGRFSNIPETIRLLREGGELTIVMLGDSIVHDTASSEFDKLLSLQYPSCSIRKISSTRGCTGCDWYAEKNRVRDWVLKYNPDLLVIGGISHRPDPSRMRDVVRQVRAEHPKTEFLLVTPVFGSDSESWNSVWTPQIDHTRPGDPRALIEQIAAEERCAFFDMTGPLGEFVRESKMARGAFMRDSVHANERGKAVLGELLNRWFSPDISERPTLIINEDNDHYFKLDRSLMTVEALESYIDSYAKGHVTHFFMCPSGQRPSYDSKVWEPIWTGIAPEYFRNDEGTNWTENAKLLYDRGVDPYAVWIRRCRTRGISPWISPRMNDTHYAEVTNYFRNTTFWRTRRDLWRKPDWKPGENGNLAAFDFSKDEARKWILDLIREQIERWDVDGVELDWMRTWEHLTPGKEREQAHFLTEMVRTVRVWTDAAAKRRGHPVKLGVRVPSDPDAALGFGMDAVGWAREGIVDQVVASCFWCSGYFGTPLAKWRERLGPVTSARVPVYPATDAGYNCQRALPRTMPYEGYCGWADAQWTKGAPGLYLFNLPYQSGDLRERICTDGLGREIVRRVMRYFPATYDDVVPMGFPNGMQMPIETSQGGEVTIVAGGSLPTGFVSVVLAAKDRLNGQLPEVTLNGTLSQLSLLLSERELDLCRSQKKDAAWGVRFVFPAKAMYSGVNSVKVLPVADGKTRWVWCQLDVPAESSTRESE